MAITDLPKSQLQGKASRRNIHAWLVLVGCLLLLATSPPSARAQEVAAFCGPTGDVTVKWGEELPLPNRFENNTDFTVSFVIVEETNSLFRFPRPPSFFWDPRFGNPPLLLGPGQSFSQPDLNFPLPRLTLPGTDRVVLVVHAVGRKGDETRSWGPFRCEYNLTVLAVEPVAYCGPTGDVIVEQGKALPLPNRFENPKHKNPEYDWTVSFVIVELERNLFHFPTRYFWDPQFGNPPLILNPGQSFSQPGLAYPLPPSTPTGTDRVVFNVRAGARKGDVSREWDLIRCEYNLTVIPPISDLIVVPVRWCAVEGSPQAEGKRGPSSNNGVIQTVPGTKLLLALQKLNDQIYVPQSDTHVFFRHANSPLGIPVIDDPDGTDCDHHDPTGICPELGVFNPFERHYYRERGYISWVLPEAIWDCERAWKKLYENERGTVLVNAKALEYAQGATLKWEVKPEEFCKFPPTLDIAVFGRVRGLALFDPAVEYDNSYFASEHLSGLGHEIGHTLFLGHGDGLDNNMDGAPAGTPGQRLYDAYCDPLGVTVSDYPVEDRGSIARSVMSSQDDLKLTPLQREHARAVAKLVPGASFTNANDPAGWLIAPHRPCEPRCDLSPDLFMTEAGMAETTPPAVTAFWHSTRGPIPANATNDYLTFVDLDNSAATGCDPATLFPGDAGFSGAELVARVTVSTVEGKEKATPTVWRCQGGAFAELRDPAIEARVLKPGVTHLPVGSPPPPPSVTITVSLPDRLRGPAEDRVRLQAITRRIGGNVDRLPATGRGGEISLIPPELPVCTLAKPALAPGERTTVRASKLTPNQPADVYVGDQIVATGATNATGGLAIDFTLPAGSRQGLRPVAVILQGGAQSATCVVVAQGNAVTPATVAKIDPAPTAASWNNTAVTVQLTATDRPGGTGIRDITYSATGAQPIPSTTVASNPATVALSNEGRTNLSFFATDRSGVAEAPQTTLVQIDKTAPAVTYSGNAGTYRITENVAITCKATDSLSGVLRTTCEDIKGPAYSFPVGANSFSAEAVDFARNTGKGSTSFIVSVSYDDLCTLSRILINPDFPPGPGLAESLCAHLQQAQRDQAAGRQDKEAERIDAYIDIVRRNVPEAFTPAKADILIKLATGCVKATC